jgi:hypothetical protein
MCKKDAPIATPQSIEDCRKPRQCPNMSHSETIGPVQRTAPYFNPNNSDEFVYLDFDSVRNCSIVFYNMRTHSRNVLITKHGDWVGYLQWHPDIDSIIFVDITDGFLYKMKPDGSGRTKIISFAGYSWPIVVTPYSATGYEQLLMQTRTNPTWIIKFDTYGNKIDSIPGNFYSHADVSRNDPVAPYPLMAWTDITTGYPGAVMARRVSDQRNVFIYVPTDEAYRLRPVMSVSWHPNGEDIYYASWLDIQKVNIASYAHTIVKRGCTDDYYGIVRVSPDGTKLLAEKFHYWNDENCKLFFNTNLVVMNIDGSDERSPF